MTTPWQVPPMFKGKTVAILASGPSMSPRVARAVQRLPRLATNSTFRLAPDANVLYGYDADWWRITPGAREFAGIKICAQDELAWPDVYSLRNTGKSGFDPDPCNLRTGGNAGYALLHITAQAAAARVLLCGFDMRGGHWHGDHPEPLKPTPPENFATWIDRFERLAPILAGMGVEVLNCTPGSALGCFPMADLAEQLKAEHEHEHC